MDPKEPIQDLNTLPETTPLTPERINEYISSIGVEAKWGAEIEFLDTVNSVEELEQIKEYIESNNIDYDIELFDWYKENLEKWKDPEKKVPTSFRELFPLISEKLDTPQKTRIFLRFADFCDVSIFNVADITEKILHQHKVEGNDYVIFPPSASPWDPKIPEILACYTQLEAWTLKKLLFPGYKRSGSADNLYIDWREQEGRR